MLNESKGPAVHSLRAQADKQDYSRQMRRTLENTEHLTIRQAEVSELVVEEGEIRGVKTFSGALYKGKCVILCTGTYLKARCIYGDVSNPTGPKDVYKRQVYIVRGAGNPGLFQGAVHTVWLRRGHAWCFVQCGTFFRSFPVLCVHHSCHNG